LFAFFSKRFLLQVNHRHTTFNLTKVTKHLNFATKFALAIAAVAALAAPSTRAQSAAKPKFEVISVKPDLSDTVPASMNYDAGRFTARNFSLGRLINNAYGPQKIVGAPNWYSSERFDVDAKVEESLAQQLQKLPFNQRLAQVMLMLQSALEDRFQLKLSHESRDLSVYALVVAKGGPKLRPTTLPPIDPDHPSDPEMRRPKVPELGQFIATGAPIASILGTVSRELGGPIVLDQTGLKGEYDFTLKWTPGAALPTSAASANQDSDSAPLPDPSGTSIFTALQEQLGLKLETKKAPVDVLVITHVERPSGN
jgi:uncharacterized protein (TIGR03435 family)